jgi:hypothetical protein
MRVQVWLRDDLTRLHNGQVASHQRITEWDDPTSSSITAAAERAWRTCSWDPSDLELEESVWRANFDDVAAGRRLSVGDVVVVDGQALRCDRAGFSPVPHP